MALIRCTSCAYANALDAKICAKCGTELRVPAHLMRCPYCGAPNQRKATVCIRCDRTLTPSWRRKLRGRTAGAVAAATVALLAVVGYYAYPRGLPQYAPRPAADVPPTSAPETPMVSPASAATETPRAGRPPGDAQKAKAPPVAVAREASAARRAGEPEAPAGGRCDEGVAALGLCGKSKAQQPARTQGCTEALAALGLCDSSNTK